MHAIMSQSQNPASNPQSCRLSISWKICHPPLSERLSSESGYCRVLSVKLCILTGLSVTDCEEHCLLGIWMKCALSNIRAIACLGERLIDWLCTMLIDIVIELKPGGDNMRVVCDVSSAHPIRAVTGGGRGERKTDRQTGRWRSLVICLCYYVSYFSVISVVGQTGFNFTQIIHLKGRDGGSAQDYIHHLTLPSSTPPQPSPPLSENRKIWYCLSVQLFLLGLSGQCCGIFALLCWTTCLLNSVESSVISWWHVVSVTRKTQQKK